MPARSRSARPRSPALLLAAAALLGGARQAQGYTVVGDGIPAPLTTAQTASAERGRDIVASRQTGLCVLCHSGPYSDDPLQGNLSTNLAGAGSRWSEAQLRLRVADARRLNPGSLMPAFHPAQLPDDIQSLVGRAWHGRPALDAQQVEDVVAYLKTLR